MDLLEQQLQAMHRQNQPDADFANQLEQTLRAGHGENAPIHTLKMPVYKRLGTIAASLLIVVILFATIPPLRSFAEDIIDFFVPGEGYVLPGNEGAYDDTVTVGTIAEAQAIAGIDALQWVDGGYTILNISAGEGVISIAYERENDRGVLMFVSKWRTGTRPEQYPISADADVILTTVNGHDAQYVAGGWFGDEPQWYNDFRHLRWQDDEFSYSLLITEYTARTLEETVAIAESLR